MLTVLAVFNDPTSSWVVAVPAGLITVETSVSPVRCLSEACAFIGTQIHNMPTVTSRHTIYVAILNLLLQLMILFFILFLSRTFQ